MTSQLALKCTQSLQKAANEATKKYNQHDKLIERHREHHPASADLNALITRVSNYPNLERREIYIPSAERVSDETDTRLLYWVLATATKKLVGVEHTTKLYLTDHGEIAVDQGWSEGGKFPSPSIKRAKDAAFIAGIFGVDDLKRAVNAVGWYSNWLTSTNDELTDLWREEHRSPITRAIMSLSLSR